MAIFQLVETGGVPMSPMIARKAMNLLMNAPKPKNSKPEDAADYNLSSRELEILKLVVDGFDSAEIAEKLYISPLTVRKHISNIYTKLHVSNKTEAVKLAVKKRWFEL
jgi:DNA-binding NarL/FixJ family response regulator